MPKPSPKKSATAKAKAAKPKPTAAPAIAPESNVTDYRHASKRKNIPTAGLAAQGKVKEVPKTRYAYDPHLPPVLRFDDTGAPDALPELLATARQRALTTDEVQLLSEALRNQQPWLEWAGKREKRWFEVDPVAVHIHERVSAQAIIKLAMRAPLQRDMFADPELDYREAVKFYQHEVAWANRLILGDSLVVMHSLAKREDLAGKVQMIYIDPPYGIKFASNFQSQVGKRDVKDKDDDLTREPEQVRAYRDTWTLGVHSYLAYLRDRLIAARDLLADDGSIFVQIGEENLHRVRVLLDEVFRSENFVSTITYRTSIALGSQFIDPVSNYLVWYVKDHEVAIRKFQRLYKSLELGDPGATRYTKAESREGLGDRLLTSEEIDTPELLLNSWRPYTDQGLTSRSGNEASQFPVPFQDREYRPTVGGWRTNPDGMRRLLGSERIVKAGDTIRFKKFFDDFGALSISNFWADVGGGIQSRSDPKIYVVQTANKIIERCMLMTTDPGDLVLDPTCGSGTTAYVAEQWGRRWITIDTSRVALALARQRLLTAKFDYYDLAEADKGVTGGFICKTVPHITLKSIAQNQALDPTFARWEPVLAEKLTALNAVLIDTVGRELRDRLKAKLIEKEKREGKSAITEADRRRWLLPSPDGRGSAQARGGEGGWREWEVPFDADPDWPEALQAALTDYRAAWRQKMDQVNATIAASAPQETLVDQPKIKPGVLRVSGPFTVEGVQPSEESLDDSPIDGAPDDLRTFPADESLNAEAYLDKMLRLLRQDGVRFPNNKTLTFQRLEPVSHSVLHAEGEWASPTDRGGEGRKVAVSFGPQYGPITAKQVEDCIRAANRRGYDDLVFAGFTFDGAAQAAIEDDDNPQVRCHLAHIRPDVNMGNLLKDTPGSQLFTVFGAPRIVPHRLKSGEIQIEMQGVDIYDPITNTINATNADKVAAWFLDADYDGRTFCVTQAFFPDGGAWESIARALKTAVDPDRFAAFSGTRSLPFKPGEHLRAAVKVIDPRGNEVMSVIRLEK